MAAPTRESSHLAISPQRAVIIGVATLITAGGAYLSAAVARRRRALDPDGAWHEAVGVLRRRGIDVSAAATPRQVVAFVDAQWRERHHQPFPESARQGLVELANAVEHHRYLPPARIADANAQPSAAAADSPDLRSSLNPIRDARPPRKLSFGRWAGDRLPAQVG